MTIHTVKRVIGGVEYVLETGRVAKQAHGSVTMRAGGTIVLAASVISPSAREGIDYFPLMVDYREQFYSAGKIPGGFFKREGKPDDRQTLVARLTDRPLRPLFPKGLRNEVIVNLLVISADNVHTPDILAMNAASASLAISNIPWHGPIAGVRVGRVNGELIANPTFEEEEESDISLIVASTKKAICMVEAGASIVSEDEIIEGLDFGKKTGLEFIEMQEELVSLAGKEKIEVRLLEEDDDLRKKVFALGGERIRAASRNPDKLARQAAMDDETAAIVKELVESDPGLEGREKEIRAFSEEIEVETVRNDIIEKGVRPDGRGLRDIREIDIEVGVLPETHGSCLFTRGQTQALGVTTLGTARDRRRRDDIEGEGEERFLLHYNFPGFSVGEAKPPRGPGRREIGHGALAKRALAPLLPAEEDFPYTIRTVSEILESNGSSSMASVCAGALSMMDGGVPIKAPAAGIAMGLISDDKGRSAILTDIQGVEDHFGDMDFKVAGTREGITALQMDIKIEGLSLDLMKQALAQAKDARLFILEKMEAVLAAPRDALSPKAPRITTIHIDPEKIKDVIGPGGKMIRKIQAETGTKLDIEDDGTLMIAAHDEETANQAREMVEYITADVELGKIYEGRVTRLMKFGAFVEILPGKDGLVHISQLDTSPVRRVEDAVSEGDVLKVKVVEIDSMGRINLSRKSVLLGEDGMEDAEIEETYRNDMKNRFGSDGDRRGRGDRDRGRGRDRDRGGRRDYGRGRGDRDRGRGRDRDRGGRDRRRD